MTARPQPKLLAELALFYAAAIWGSTFFMVKGALAGIDPVVLVGYRFTLAAAVLALALSLRRKPLWANLRHGLVLGVVLWILYIAQTIGLGITTASNSGFITGLFIVFVPLLAFLFHRARPRRRHLVAVGLALGGLWLLTGGVRDANLGDVLTLAAAVTYAYHVVYAGRLVNAQGALAAGAAGAVDPWVLNFQQMLACGLLALLTALIHGALTPQPLAAHFAIRGTPVLLTVLFLTLFPTITAYAAQLYGQRVVDATRTALIFTFEPVFAAAFAWTLGGELLQPWHAAGGLLIVAAMIVSEVGNPWKPQARAAQT